MDRMNFVKNGVLRLPPGFRFHPTDEELVVQYLRRKVLSCPLPASIIPEVDVCKSHPWDLPGNLEQERFFFSTREVKYPNGNRSNRATVSGYWKATGLDKQIVSCRGNQVVGMKKTLVFYRGKPPTGSRTDWIMHEYRLLSPQSAPNNAPPAKTPTLQGMENWVLCRIFLKKRNGKQNEEEKEKTELEVGNRGISLVKTTTTKPVFYDFMGRERADLNLAPVSSSSGSSGITDEVSSSSARETEDHEESSSTNCNKLSNFRSKDWA